MAPEDAHNYSSSSHRLPTVSASQVLEELDTGPSGQSIPTGLTSLDATLDGRDPDGSGQAKGGGGFARRQISEVYGPPGAGKTTLAMQLTAHALSAQDHVVWVDCGFPLVGPRLKQIMDGVMNSRDEHLPSTSPDQATSDNTLKRLHHFHTPTLPHLLTLLHHSLQPFPPPGTSLIVIDSVSILFSIAFPRTVDEPATPIREGRPSLYKTDARQWAANRRWAVMGDFISNLGKLAAVRNLAVLLISQTSTRVKSDSGAILVPALSSTSWDGGISSRVVLYRDWPSVSTSAETSEVQVRFAGVIKARGVKYNASSVGQIVAFTIDDDGLHEHDVPPLRVEIAAASEMSLPEAKKRKRKQVADSQSDDDDDDDNVEESDDEDYGWVEDVMNDEPTGGDKGSGGLEQAGSEG